MSSNSISKTSSALKICLKGILRHFKQIFKAFDILLMSLMPSISNCKSSDATLPNKRLCHWIHKSFYIIVATSVVNHPSCPYAPSRNVWVFDMLSVTLPVELTISLDWWGWQWFGSSISKFTKNFPSFDLFWLLFSFLASAQDCTSCKIQERRQVVLQ